MRKVGMYYFTYKRIIDVSNPAIPLCSVFILSRAMYWFHYLLSFNSKEGQFLHRYARIIISNFLSDSCHFYPYFFWYHVFWTTDKMQKGNRGVTISQSHIYHLTCVTWNGWIQHMFKWIHMFSYDRLVVADTYNW